MKKKILFLCVLSLFIGCKSYRDFIKIKKEYSINSLDKLNNGRIITVRINGKKANLLFDTGASKSIIFNLDILGRESILKENSNKILVKGPSSKQYIRKIITDSIAFNAYKSFYQQLFISDNHISNNCNSGAEFDGLLGIDAFFENEDFLSLDFEKEELKIVDKYDSDYIPVDAVFTKNSIYVKGEINKEKHLFLFDTGADFSILIDNKNTNFPILGEIEMLVRTIDEKKPKNAMTTFYELDRINIGGSEIENPLISNVSTINKNIIGYEFIKRFNWIIDFKNKKIYAKKNSKSELRPTRDTFKTICPKAVGINGKLIIVLKKTSQKEYSIGDEIIAVNNQKITSENICNMQKLLNETSDWSKLNLETVAATKI